MNHALILAGGEGVRMGAGVPKQYAILAGRPILDYSLRTFLTIQNIDTVCVVCANCWKSEVIALFSALGKPKPFIIAPAGETRRQSSANGVRALLSAYSPDDIVLIHDAARPFITESIIKANIEASRKYGACSTALPCENTVYSSETGEFVGCVPPRRTLYTVQTPQSFTLSLIAAAHENFEKSGSAEVTDDASLVHLMGIPVAIVPGSKTNIKITTQDDLALAELVCRENFSPMPPTA